MSVSFCQTLFKLFYGAPKRSRTPNLLIRSQTLYPIELWALIQFVSSTCISLSLLSNLVKHFSNFFYGAPKRSRTPNLLIRSQTLYPIELWALIQFVSSTCISLSLLSNLVKHFSNFFYGAPKRSRTPNLLIRSQTLYPIELWALI